MGGGADIGEGHGAYVVAILPFNRRWSATAFSDVAAEAAGVAFFIRGLDVNLEIEQVAEGWPVKAEETFYEDDWTGGDGFCGFEPRVGDEAVAGLLDAKAELEAFYVANQQGCVEGGGMIEIEIGSPRFWNVSAIHVIVIEGEGECVVEQLTGETAGEFRLAGATGSGDANEEGLHDYWFCPVDMRRRRAASGMIFQLPVAVEGKLFFCL